jgi:hypothetical protein
MRGLTDMDDQYVIALLAAGFVGVLYAILINFVNHYFGHVVKGMTWLEVVIGVGMTLAICLVFLSLEVVLQVFCVFAVTGGLMSAGCIVRDRWVTYRAYKADLEHLKKRLAEDDGRQVGEG